jgi:soluble lytic murein transglycosylase-like protein
VRQQLETADDLAEQITIASIEAKAFHDETVSAAERKVSLGFPASGRVNQRQRYHLLTLTIALLVTAITGALLYQHWRLKVKPDAFANKVYTQMTDAEQLAFIDQREQWISEMMGDRPVKLDDEALRAIKTQLDRYVARERSTSQVPGEERLREIYSRAHPYVPLIARAFAARKIPLVVGIYLPMIESEYKPCFENSIGAKGLFQFLPQTAKNYGVAKAEMCDVEKMAPAAAHYIADRMAELGDDSESMTLVLLSYNTGPEWVRDTLRQLRETDKYRRNFWTLFANRDKLSDAFRREGASYIPGFFAAAIIGENPQNFDLQMPALSSLARDRATAKK